MRPSSLSRTLGSLALLVLAADASAQCGQEVPHSSPNPSDGFGHAVDVLGDVMAVGAWQDDDLGVYSGAVYLYERQADGSWLEVDKLHAGDGAQGDKFGTSVALAQDLLVVGSPVDGDHGPGTGAVYVFERGANGWSEIAKLVPDAADADDWVGFAVDVSPDGERIVAGAHHEDVGGDFAGSVWVFDRVFDNWIQTAHLVASDAAAADYFGFSVAVDGDTLLVGAFGNDDQGVGSGSAYVFEQIGLGWTQTQKLLASDGAAIDFFGYDVDLDGDQAVIGAYGKDVVGPLSGAVYVFQHVNGVGFLEVQRVTPHDRAVDQHFGVAVSLEGAYLAVGAQRHAGGGPQAGAGYVFERIGVTWTPFVGPITGLAGERQGDALALRQDTLVLGRDPGPGSTGGVRVIAGATVDCNGNGRADSCDLADGTSFDGDGDGVPDECSGVSAHCTCEAGAPCGNVAGAGAGCASSLGVGARLVRAAGGVSSAADDLVLRASDLPPGSFALVILGADDQAPAALGSGLRCVDLPFLRFPAQSTGVAGEIFLGPGILTVTQNLFPTSVLPQPGETWHFQTWYRDPAGSCATSGLTNALAVTFAP